MMNFSFIGLWALEIFRFYKIKIVHIWSVFLNSRGYSARTAEIGNLEYSSFWIMKNEFEIVVHELTL